MGNKLFRSKIVRPLQNYNVESRAMKAIEKVEKQQQKAAPPYPNMKKVMDDIRQDPNLLHKRAKLDPGFESKLKDVYLTSEGEWPEIKTKQQKMPVDRESHERFEYGYEEPEVIPEGKVTLRQITEFLKKNQENPGKYAALEIAEEYKLKFQDAENILNHFKPFEIIYKPKPVDDRSSFMKAIKA